jgi:manganese oxidase
MRSALPLAAAFLLVSIAGCLDGPKAGSVDGATVVPTGPTVELDLYVTGTQSYEPQDGKRIGGFAFSLSPDGPFTVPGPELRFRQGDHVRVTLHGADHTVHWHGLDVPWAMDGVPYMTQTLGAVEEVYVYEFDALQSGTYWYHCHVDAPTHVDFGLFGPLVIEPADPGADPPFDREATLMLHEMDSQHFLNNPAVGSILFEDPGHDPTDLNAPSSPWDAPAWAVRNGRSAYDFAGLILSSETGQSPISVGPREYYPHGSIRYQPYYDTFMINGMSFPKTEPLHIESGETMRIRLIHAGQLMHTMHLHGHHFLVTHKDGYLLQAPYWADTLVIGPGERYDLYVQGTNPGLWDFHDHGGAWELGAYAANDHAFPGGMNTMLVYDDFEFPGLPEPEAGATSGDYWIAAQEALGVRHQHRGH